MADSAGGWIGWSGGPVSLRVDRDNVMKAIRIVLDEAERYEAKLADYKSALLVTAPGGDPVSGAAQGTLNQRGWKGAESYYWRCVRYVRTLEAMADQFAAAARTYGYTEEEVAALFPTPTADRVDGDHYVV